ncbi:hypothetical protein Tco_1284699 [Tanacetum coccineum]
MEVADVQFSGLNFTWNQKPRGEEGQLKKIDRIMANMEFNDVFLGAHAIFQPYRILDHSPAILSIPTCCKVKPKPFKFTNLLVHNERFKELVKDKWCMRFSGFHMYCVVQKLKSLKKPLRKLLFDHGNLHDNVVKLRMEVDKVQKDLDMDPFNINLREEEAAYVQAFNEALIMEERFLKQKAKIEWLRVGDSNSAYFHKSVKSRVSRSRINVISNSEGIVFSGDQVANAFVSHYEEFLGHKGQHSDLNTLNLFPNKLDPEDALNMIRPVTQKEVKDAMFSMGNDKSPGPDGFTAAFFKEAWDIVFGDVTKAIQEFFMNGCLLKELNHTIIALIPKVQSPSRINDYRPISCCNVLFKCITKIIANRIKESLKILVSPNQSAFVPGRRISDNILLTQELMHNYHLDRGSPRCAFKVDIQKAYDTVDWVFLKEVLHGFGFHNRMISWIMECVGSTSFSISINGVLHGYFKGKRGLRQGDPLSPYLFTLVMEVLTLIIQRRVRDSDFVYHRYCSKLELVNLCFADDLFLFTHGDVHSATILMEALTEFKLVSGLVPSIPKSTAYFCNVLNHVKIGILSILPFEEGRLPVKYLGVPLISSRLIFRDCKELIEKVQHRIQDWKNKSLSAAGRLQLVQSVISSMHVYWASVFILPSRILLDIEQLMRGFLWCQGTMQRGRAKVAWDVICLPKKEGGLGLRKLELFNKALMTSHVWDILRRKESLWIKWIHVYKIRERNFWDLPLRGNITWGWRKILQLRPIIRDFIWFRIGDGSQVSMWYDRWCNNNPLSNIISIRDIHLAGYNLNTKAKDAISDGNWNWPLNWITKYHALNNIYVPNIVQDGVDILEWRVHGGLVKQFSVAAVWHNIRVRDVEVAWQVWDNLKVLAGIPQVVPSIDAIVDFLAINGKRRTTKAVIAKLVIAASTYVIWQERNWRLFKGQKWMSKQVSDCIHSVVRLKLLSCRFRKSKD